MDLNKFLPDSNAIRKTNWSKPDLNFDTKDPFRLIAAGGALLMIIFVFLTLVSLKKVNQKQMMLLIWLIIVEI